MLHDATIRPAVTEDLPAITAIYGHHVVHGTASFELEPPGIDEMRRRWDAITRAGLPYLVIDLSGQIAGYAYAGPYRPRAAYRSTVEDSIYLLPTAVRHGYGRRLLRSLIDACEDIGLRQMIAVIGDSATVASIRLHESLGFALTGVLRNVGYKHGRWLDSVVLQRTLGDGDARPPDLRIG